MPAIHDVAERATGDALGAGLALKLGFYPRNHRGERDDDLANRGNEFQHLDRLTDFAKLGLRLPGYPRPHEVMSIAHTRAQVSGTSLSAIFTTTFEAGVMMGFERARDTTKAWTSETEVDDFSQYTRLRLETMGGSLKKLPRGDSADHATLSDLSEVGKIFRYAEQFIVDEQDIVDDRFDRLQSVPVAFGEKAISTKANLVYYHLMSNPDMRDSVALFHAATHGNLETSAALAADKLKTAVKAMFVQTEDGTPLNIAPKNLLVPPSLLHTARALAQSVELSAGGGNVDANMPTLNPLLDDNLGVVADARLENGVTDPNSGSVASGSATTWYLVADPMRVPTVEIAYLRGGRVPSVRSSVLNRGQWGLAMDVKYDLGVKALDWRGLVKNTA